MPFVRHPKYRELFKKAGSTVWWAYLPRTGPGRMPRESTGQRDDVAAHRWYLDRIRTPDKAAEKDQVTLGSALEARYDERAAIGRSAGTLEVLEQKAGQLNRVLGEHTLLSEVDARLVDGYIRTRIAEGIKKITIGKELQALFGAMKLARRQGYECRAVDEVRPLDFSSEYKPRTRALSETEVDRLMAALPPKRAAIVAFIVATSATYPSEVANVLRTDVDMEKWMVRLRGTKRALRNRVVPVPGFAHRWLRFAVRHADGRDGKLFTNWLNIKRDLRLLCKKLSKCEACRKKAKKNCAACADLYFAHTSPNDLRRTFGHFLRARGVEPQLIAPAMGHVDGQMVEKVYGRLQPEELAHLLKQRLGGQPVARPRKKSRKAA